MKRILLIYCIFSLISFQSNAQFFNDAYTPAVLRNYIPPAPDAASLGKYAEIPVSYSTGIPQISIPFFTIETGTINLPVSLSYHSSGAKVEEEASWVGLGWSLNAGGVITRVVKGIPDDQYTIYGTNYDYRSGFGSDGFFNEAGYFYSNSKIEAYYNGTYNSLNGLTNEVALGQVDGDPDIFYYNFGKYSGSFIFDQNRIPRLTSGSDLKITFEQKDANGNLSNTGLISSFVIIAEDGTKFYFNDAEESRVFAGKLEGDENVQIPPYNPYYFNLSTFLPHEWLTYISSWYLSRVEAASGPQQISFSYDTVNSLNLSNTSQKSFYGQDYGGAGYLGSGVYRFIDHWSNSLIGIHQKKLKRIDWDNGHITFESNYPRIDTRRCMNCITPPPPSISISAALTDINIFSSNPEPIRMFRLSYSNFASPGVSGIPAGADYGYYRLRLDSIQESSSGISLPAYQFFYDNSVSLPHRFTFEQDFWGYFNGAGAANTSLVPSIYMYPDCNVSTSVYHSIYSVFPRNNGETEYLIPGANRNSDINYAKAGILNRINYPLGGHETFDYELNTFKVDVNTIHGGGLRISEIKRYASDIDPNPETTTYSYTNTDGTTSGVVLNIPEFAYYNYIDSRCITETNSDMLRKMHTIRFSSPQVGLGAEQSLSVNYQRVTFQNPGNGKTVNEYLLPIHFGVNYLLIAGDTIYKRTCGLGLSNFPFAPNPNFDVLNGKLKSESIFNNSMKIKETRYVYNIKNYGKIRAFTSKSMKNESCCYCNDHPVFMVPVGSKYYFLYAWVVLSQKTEIDFYASGDSLKKVSDYYYNAVSHKQLTGTKSNSSIPDQNIEIKFQYPPDMNIGVYQAMALPSRNMVAFPVEQTKYVNNKVIASQLNSYKLENNYYVPYQLFKLETKDPLTSFTPFNGLVKDSHYKTPEIEYLKYDTYSNPLFISSVNANTTYIWGYSSTLPVAKITGLSYSEMESSYNSVMNCFQNNSNLPNTSDFSTVSTKVAVLKSQASSLLNSTFCMFTFYTYSPLIGMTSQTDAKGVSTYYQYDSFGRLCKILDNSGNIVKEYQYHYKN